MACAVFFFIYFLLLLLNSVIKTEREEIVEKSICIIELNSSKAKRDCEVIANVFLVAAIVDLRHVCVCISMLVFIQNAIRR